MPSKHHPERELCVCVSQVLHVEGTRSRRCPAFWTDRWAWDSVAVPCCGSGGSLRVLSRAFATSVFCWRIVFTTHKSVYAAFPPCDVRVTQAHLPVCVYAFVPPCFAADWDCMRRDKQRSTEVCLPHLPLWHLKCFHICISAEQIPRVFSPPTHTHTSPPSLHCADLLPAPMTGDGRPQ